MNNTINPFVTLLAETPLRQKQTVVKPRKAKPAQVQLKLAPSQAELYQRKLQDMSLRTHAGWNNPRWFDRQYVI